MRAVLVGDQSRHYSRFEEQDLILREELALDRTRLANERTLLAYLRTSLALVLAGVTFLHFSNAIWFSIFGAACLVIGLFVVPIAVRRYRRMEAELSPLRRRIDDAASTFLSETGRNSSEITSDRNIENQT